MKKIYFWAIALSGLLLASCNKEEAVKDDSAPGNPAVMQIRMTGDANTKATLPNPLDESKIAKGMVFVFRGTGLNPVLDGKASFDFSTAPANPVSVNITAGPNRHVYVVANIANANDFNGITKLSDLYNLTNKYQLTAMRTNTNLGMSGFVSNIDATAATTATPVGVVVPLRFLGSQVHMDWDITAAQLTYPGFTITGAYLLNVKSQSDYFAAPGTYLTANVNTYLRGKNNISTFTGSYLPVSPATNTYDAALAMANLATDKGFLANSFYVLENNSPAPTIVVLEGTYNSTVYYYPIVINGDQNGSGLGGIVNPGDKSSTVSRSNIYHVKAYISGLGNNDPYDPLVKGSLNVTIVTATWNPVILIDQEFN